MDYADHMEDRAQERDAEDPECASCGHPLTFHLRYDLATAQPCDYHHDEAMQTLCGCQQFTEKQ